METSLLRLLRFLPFPVPLEDEELPNQLGEAEDLEESGVKVGIELGLGLAKQGWVDEVGEKGKLAVLDDFLEV